MNLVSTTCRACGQAQVEKFLSLGKVPLADAILTEAQLSQPEPTYALDIGFCPHCALVQILETVPPEKLFDRDYLYFSSYSDTLLQHSRENAEELIRARHLGRSSLVLEIASNDGYMLKNFQEHDIPVLGIDPAEEQARAAEQAGIPTLCRFFDVQLAQELREEGKQADVIIANNIMAHVPNLNGLVQGMRTLLKDDGVIVTESPYVKDLIDQGEFDTMYHEHVFYYSVTAAHNLFRSHSLALYDIRHLPIHGGSLRYYVGRDPDVQPSVAGYLEQEKALGLDRIAYYENFAKKVQATADALARLLQELQGRGKRIAAYGAAAKGTTLINYAGIGKELIDFVVDRNPYKQGRYMPGQKIPIVAPERLLEEMPDYLLILAWNFKDEIMAQQSEYRRRGGSFIIPIPQPTIA